MVVEADKVEKQDGFNLKSRPITPWPGQKGLLVFKHQRRPLPKRLALCACTKPVALHMVSRIENRRN